MCVRREAVVTLACGTDYERYEVLCWDAYSIELMRRRRKLVSFASPFFLDKFKFSHQKRKDMSVLDMCVIILLILYIFIKIYLISPSALKKKFFC